MHQIRLQHFPRHPSWILGGPTYKQTQGKEREKT